MITVLFSCKECGIVKAKAYVRDRHQNEDIKHYLDEIAVQVSIFHALESPPEKNCRPRTISEVYIPLPKDETKGIGFQ